MCFNYNNHKVRPSKEKKIEYSVKKAVKEKIE